MNGSGKFGIYFQQFSRSVDCLMPRSEEYKISIKAILIIRDYSPFA